MTPEEKYALVGNKYHYLTIDKVWHEKELYANSCWMCSTTCECGTKKSLRLVEVLWCKINYIPEITTWSDNRWSNGDVYHKMGFTLVKEYGPDYSYVLMDNPKKRFYKQQMQKSKIGCPPEKTEKQFLNELGYSRIWDCGKKKFTLKIK